MKKIVLFLVISTIITSCGGGSVKTEDDSANEKKESSLKGQVVKVLSQIFISSAHAQFERLNPGGDLEGSEYIVNREISTDLLGVSKNLLTTNFTSNFILGARKTGDLGLGVEPELGNELVAQPSDGIEEINDAVISDALVENVLENIRSINEKELEKVKITKNFLNYKAGEFGVIVALVYKNNVLSYVDAVNLDKNGNYEFVNIHKYGDYATLFSSRLNDDGEIINRQAFVDLGVKVKEQKVDVTPIESINYALILNDINENGDFDRLRVADLLSKGSINKNESVNKDLINDYVGELKQNIENLEYIADFSEAEQNLILTAFVQNVGIGNQNLQNYVEIISSRAVNEMDVDDAEIIEKLDEAVNTLANSGLLRNKLRTEINLVEQIGFRNI
jgi:hypothetical protein